METKNIIVNLLIIFLFILILFNQDYFNKNLKERLHQLDFWELVEDYSHLTHEEIVRLDGEKKCIVLCWVSYDDSNYDLFRDLLENLYLFENYNVLAITASQNDTNALTSQLDKYIVFKFGEHELATRLNMLLINENKYNHPIVFLVENGQIISYGTNVTSLLSVL